MQPLAFVDLETTGTSLSKDRITEIGIVLVDEHGVREWSQLLHPQMRVPPFIEQLTGISNAMVANAPCFAEIAEQVAELLQGRIFIAHNAGFDYGFLKSEFKRTGLSFKPSVLCTVKLSRALYPQHRHHNLDSLIQRHQLTVSDRHRALADAKLIYQFWQCLTHTFPAEELTATVQRLIKRASLPSQLDPQLIYDLPESAGVYLFYGQNNLPLYIGKSINIKQRVLSHFSASASHSKEMKLAQQTQRIEWIETAGELGALLLEARLIKQKTPLFNQRLRQKQAFCAWQIEQQGRHLTPQLKWADALALGQQDNLYGLYANPHNAQKALRHLAQQHQLCLSVMGLEKTAPHKPCFAYQLKQCKGACIGLESAEEHANRLLTAMQVLKLITWPYAGPIGIKEAEDLHIIDHWCYLGTAKTEHDIQRLLAEGRPAFDRDTYLTLIKALTHHTPIILKTPA